MIRPVIALLFSFALTAFATGQDPKSDPHKQEELKLSKDEQEVIDLMNAERKKAELLPLKMNPKLMVAAREHAANMAKQDKLAHELDDKKPADRVKAAEYEYGYVGENIA